MRPPASQGLNFRGTRVAGTPAIAAPGASNAIDFYRLLENDELLPYMDAPNLAKLSFCNG
jgi:hypothetical protein